MKKILVILTLTFCGAVWGQKRPIRTDQIKVDTLTTTERDALTATPGSAQLIYNSTTDQFEQKKPDGSWEPFGGSSPTAWDDITDKPANLDTDSTDDLTTSDLIDDDTFATATSNNIASAESTKAYVDAVAAGAAQNLDEVLTEGNDAGGKNINNLGNISLSNSNKILGSISTPLGSLYVKPIYFAPTSPATKTFKVTQNNNFNHLFFEMESSAGAGDHSVVASISDTSAPELASDLTRKDYVDNAVAGATQDADGISYDSSSNPLTATTVQEMGDEIMDHIYGHDTYQTPAYTDYFVYHNAAANAYRRMTFDLLPYSNSTSGLTATTIQGAADELAADVASAKAVTDNIDLSGAAADKVLKYNSVTGKWEAGDDEEGTDSGQGMAAVTKSAGAAETYGNDDITESGSATGKKRWNRHVANDTVYLGGSITNYDQFWLEQNFSLSDSTLVLKETPAVVFRSRDSILDVDGVVLKNFWYTSIAATSSKDFFFDGYYEGVDIWSENLLANSTFDNATGWTINNSPSSYISDGYATVYAKGSITVTGSNAPLQTTSTTVFTVDGTSRHYSLQFRARRVSGTGNIQAGPVLYAEFAGPITSTWTTYYIEFDYSRASGYGNMVFGGVTAGNVYEVDDVVVRVLLSDQ